MSDFEDVTFYIDLLVGLAASAALELSKAAIPKEGEDVKSS